MGSYGQKLARREHENVRPLLVRAIIGLAPCCRLLHRPREALRRRWRQPEEEAFAGTERSASRRPGVGTEGSENSSSRRAHDEQIGRRSRAHAEQRVERIAVVRRAVLELQPAVLYSLGQELAQRNFGLVYGGGNVGLMGAVAKAARTAGAPVVGVIPRALQPREVSGEVDPGIETHVTEGMHDRKATMAAVADAFIALPGGFGTLEETLEMITWQQLGYHNKPVGLLNINGFYDGLLGFFDSCVEKGFIRPASRSIVLSSSDAGELLDQLAAYRAPESVVSLAMRGALG